MEPKTSKSPESVVREIKRKTRRKFNSEEKIRIILEGLKGEDSIAAICRREGMTSAERSRIKELERENRELRRANEILRKASAYFAQAELDRRPKR